MLLDDRLSKATFTDGGDCWTQERPVGEGFQLENEAFARALVEGREPELTAFDGMQAIRIVLAADASIRTGGVQSL